MKIKNWTKFNESIKVINGENLYYSMSYNDYESEAVDFDELKSKAINVLTEDEIQQIKNMKDGEKLDFIVNGTDITILCTSLDPFSFDLSRKMGF